MLLVTRWFGTFLCDGETVRESRLFPKDPKGIAQRLAAIQRGEVLEEERALAPRAREILEPRLRAFGRLVRTPVTFLTPEAHGYSAELFREATLELARQATRRQVGSDLHIMQAVRALDDLEASTNLLSERLREWYGLHFPELENIRTGRAYAELIAEQGSRDAVIATLGAQYESLGSDIQERDLRAVVTLARGLAETYRAREALDRYIERAMDATAPNLAALAGPLIGARLLSLAGGLGRLARLPASTVQLLGAERALFRHLRDGSPAPKHGILYQHPLVHQAPPWQRGAIARAFGTKTALAARADFYGGAKLSSDLSAALHKRIEEIRRTHTTPPARPRRPAERRPRHGRRPMRRRSRGSR